MRTVPSSEPDTRREPSGVKTGAQFEAIAVSAKHTDQFARLGIPEAKCRIFRGGDDARTVRAEEDMRHPARMPAQDGQQLPRVTVPEPRRLVQRGRDHPLAVRAEGNRADAILVSGEDSQQPAGGRVPEARRVIRVIAPGNQPRPVRAEEHAN